MKKWLIGVVIALSAIVFVAFLSGLVIYTMASRGPSIRDNTVLVLNVNGWLEETAPQDWKSFLLFGQRPSLKTILDNIEKARVDGRISGIILKIGVSTLGFAKVQEIRDKIVEFKDSGKPVISFLEFGGNKEYYLATVGDHIYLLPSGILSILGLKYEIPFIRGTLDKLEVYPDFIHEGDYKSAIEFFTRSDMSNPHREMIEALMDDLYEQYLLAVAQARGMAVDDVEKIVDQGPFDAYEAYVRGLVDSLVYEDEVEAMVRAKNGNDVEIIDGKLYSRVQASSLGLNRGPKIALIYGVGEIHLGKSFSDPFVGRILGSDSMIDHIRQARDDRAVQAIVLRIDSPGGFGTAADVIWREITLAREEKPFIVSLSDVAASGGYYLAMAADTIVAQPGSITGSIGVFGGKLAMKGFYDKIGVTKEIVTRGRYAAIFSDYRPFTPAEREKLQGSMRSFYDDFVAKAAQGRGMSFDEMEALARGRVWTGRQGAENGLVDELGGLGTAVAIAKARAGIPQESPVQLDIYPRPKGLLESFLGFEQVESGFVPAELRQILRIVGGNRFYRGILALLPYPLEIE